MQPDRGGHRLKMENFFAHLFLIGLLYVQVAVIAADTCSFEQGMCTEWISSSCSKQACFEVRKAANMTNGPAADHTLGTDQGSSAYATQGTWLSIAELTRKATGPLCFTAWYHLSGTESGEASFRADYRSGWEKDFYVTRQELAGRWQRVRYSEKRSGDVKITIHYRTKDSPEKAVFALDDLTLESGECPPEPNNGSCDFDWGDACGYNLGSGTQKWLLEGSDRKRFYNPDYSTNSRQGGLVYYQATGNLNISAALSSPVLPGRANIQCLQFKYYLPRLMQAQEDVPMMSVAVRGSEYFLPWVRSTRELIGDEWTPVDLAFKVEKNFQIEFRCNAKTLKYSKPYCAIDAIRLGDCKGTRAPEDGLCNFEDGWCSWKNRDDWSNKPAWQLGSSATKTTLLRPHHDHTFGNATPTGSYLFFSNYQRRTGDKAELVGELLPRNTKITQCAEFWYITEGDKSTKLEVLSIGPDDASWKHTPLWGQEGGGSATWQLGRVAVPNNKRVVFRATVGPASTPAYVALDDIAIGHHDRCETSPQDAEALSAADLVSCNLRRLDLCHWISFGLPSTAWTFGNFYHTELGPSSAPKNSQGGTVYMTGTNLARGQGTVLLQSPVVGQQSEPSCFSFWYHMFGGRGASLSLSVAKPDTASENKWRSSLLFDQRGRTTADRWYNVRRTVLLDGAHNKITFTVKNVPSMRKAAIVALNALKLTPGACDVLTDGEGYCDFELDACTWSASNGWQRQQKQGAITFMEGLSGPVNSVYVMTATQPASSSNGATLTSPEWEGRKEPRCMEFWYASTGKNGSQLQVEVVVNGKSQVVWKKPSYKQRQWMLVRTQFVQEQNFKVLFRSKFTDDPNQSVSLDDVVLRPEPCVHPADCDFSDDLCGYVNKFQGDFRWLVGPGRLESPWRQPDWPLGQGRDFTFAYLDLTTGKAEKDVSDVSQRVKTVRLLSPLFEVIDDYTSVALQYFRSGQDITSAKLSVSCFGDGDKGKVQHDLELSEVTEWTTVNVTLQRDTNCQLGVLVARGDGAKGAMAISSVKVTASKQDVSPILSSDSPTRCTFEDGTMCGWRATSMSIEWALNDPSKKLPDFPRFDHTLKAYRGRFLYASNDKYLLETARLESPELEVNATNGACLSLWLFTDHARYNNFVVLVGGENVFRAIGRASHRWEHVLVDFKKDAAKFKISIKDSFRRGLIALDDIQVDSGSCPMRDFCSWEKGSPCLLTPAPGSFGTWERRRAAVLGFSDHTVRNNLEGHYLYLNTTGVDSHHPVARVFLQTRPPTEATCVTFWWSGRGAVSQLNVYRFTKETVLQDPLVSVSTNGRPGFWIPRTVTISSRSSWNLVFEGVAAAGVKIDSGIMLDDVEFKDGECPPYNLCTFEDECLTWEIPTKGDEAGFEVERAGSFDKLPHDHTTQTADGYYLLFKSPGTEGNRTSMELREPLRYDCLSFWYYLPALSDGVKLNLQEQTLSVGKGVWKRHQTPSPSLWGKPIVATSGRNPDGFVAIDDILVNEQHCSELTRTTATIKCDNKTVTSDRVCDFVPDCDDGTDELDCGECDFSKGSCGWELDVRFNNYISAWRLKAIGDVPQSPRAGADGRLNGHYLLLYSNVTASRRPGMATINSPSIRNTNKLCTLHFWYNCVGNGSFVDVDLFMKVAAYQFPVWTLSALSRTPNEGVWNEAIIDVGRYPGTVSFSLTGSRYIQGQSMFAVDLIRYEGCALPAKEGNCSSFQFHCANGACVGLYARCNYADDCGDNSDEQDCGGYRLGCNFDSSFCDWVPEAPSEGEKTWTLGHSSSFLAVGPTRDHTIGTPEGRFLLLRPGSKKTVATIIGHTLGNNETCAITFFYTIQGEADSHLKLASRTTRDGPWKTVWEVSTPTQFFHFIEAMVAFHEDAPYQVAFIGEHKKPGSKRGYIAVDDVTFWESCKPYHGELPKAPAPTPSPSFCAEDEFECSGIRQCIPRSQLCDFRVDCSNGADESRCGACEFSTDLCGLENEDPNARFGWNLTTVEDGKTNKLFPTTDSRSNDNGAYAAFSLMNHNVPEGHSQALVTPRLGQISHSCVVSFYAYVPNKNLANLLFGVLPGVGNNTNSADMRPLATMSATALKGQWTKITVKVGNWNAGARFFYRANSLGVSIDNPEYRHCHPDTRSEEWEATRNVSCDFSAPIDCGWFPERLKTDAAWTLYSGGSGKRFLPWQPIDSVSHKGMYMYARNTFVDMRTAHLVSMKIGPTPDTGRCFTFWYNMWNPNVGQLNILQRVDNASTSVVWSRAGPQGQDWKQGQVQLHSEDPHQLVFEAVLAAGNPGMIAIDNFILKDGACDNGKVCTFESDTCGWQLHNWERTSGSSVVRPQSDYNTQSPSGRFALALSPGGRMVSPQGWYDGSRHKCLRFWFFISGSSAEALNVSRVSDDREEESLWSATKADAPVQQWFSAAVSLLNYTKTAYVVFEGTTSADQGASVAVDDISIGETACPSPGSCSFEEDMCNWYNSRDLSYAQWYRHSGTTVSNSTGVDKDHTVGTKDGFYLLLDAEDMAQHRLGSLRSEMHSFGPTVCFRFYYFMKQGSRAHLTVTFLDVTGLEYGHPTNVPAAAPSEWTLLSVERSDIPSRFFIVITGQSGQGSSDVAIDDIDVRPGKCEPAVRPTSSPPPASTAGIPARSLTTKAAITSEPVFTEEFTARPSTMEAAVTSEAEDTWPTAEVPSEVTATGVPTTQPPRPSVECPRGRFNCRDGSTCIPAVLLCDGVRDCPNGLDEVCGTAPDCKDDEFYCPSRSPSSCLPRSKLCDGHEDCSGGSDESLCRECPRYFCQNNAICQWTPQAAYPACNCSHGYGGSRCQMSAEILSDKLPLTESASSGSVVTGVIVVLVIIVLAVAVTVFFIRRRRVARDPPLFHDNPSYDASTDQTRLF